MKAKRLFRYKNIYVFIVGFSILWCFLFISVPFFRAGGSFLRKTAVFIMYFFAPVCHQIAERSFHIMNYPLAVCARCSGIYLGFLFGAVSYPFIRKLDSALLPPRWILGISVIPMIFETSLSRLGLIPTNRFLMGFSGLVPGAVIAFFVIPAVFQLVDILIKNEVNDYGRKTE
ncbi:DUF2085 domain-containing protein [bacterium]|nr:DUF2085 domain-containing protein [bacterium]RQV93285.1 MAG: DUF2085 domain-containing protein [bacterium]